MTHDADEEAGPAQGATSQPGHSLFAGARNGQSTIHLIASSLAVEHGSDGVLIADMGVRGQPIVHVNPAFERVTGYSSAEAIGKNCRYLQGNDRLQPALSEVRAALADGRACSVTLRNYKRDGTMFRNALRLVPLRDDAGEVTHFVGLISECNPCSRHRSADRAAGSLRSARSAGRPRSAGNSRFAAVKARHRAVSPMSTTVSAMT